MIYARTRNYCRREGEQILYRGISPLNKPRRYPGTYYTENPELAKHYSRGGKVIVRHGFPRNPLIIDDLIKLSDYQQKRYMAMLLKFLRTTYPTMDPEDTQLYDNLSPNPPTDFSYPVQADVDFLITLGYDSVYFSTEGGDRVDTWFVFDEK